MCGKIGHPTADRAMDHVRSLKRRDKDKKSGQPRHSGAKLVAYRCGRCGAWHVGHESRRIARRRPR